MKKTTPEGKIQRAKRMKNRTGKVVVNVDLQALAQEVYELLKKELRLENDRRGRRS